MIQYRRIILLIGLCLLATMPLAFARAPSQAEIKHLLDFVDQSGCRFNRNGTWYDSHKARLHLEQKRDYLAKRNMLPTAESFIQRAASQSSLSGKPYLVQCGDGPTLPSSTWLSKELLHYRSTTPATN
jgi:hypothetical protein